MRQEEEQLEEQQRLAALRRAEETQELNRLMAEQSVSKVQDWFKEHPERQDEVEIYSEAEKKWHHNKNRTGKLGPGDFESIPAKDAPQPLPPPAQTPQDERTA